MKTDKARGGGMGWRREEVGTDFQTLCGMLLVTRWARLGQRGANSYSYLHLYYEVQVRGYLYKFA